MNKSIKCLEKLMNKKSDTYILFNDNSIMVNFASFNEAFNYCISNKLQYIEIANEFYKELY